MTRKEMVIWAAGFIDGEGCFAAFMARSAGRDDYLVLSLQVTQADMRPLEDLKWLWDGRIDSQYRKEPGRKATWQWRLRGASRIILALDEIDPYLRVKHEQSEVMRALCMTMIERESYRLTPAIRSQREALLAEMSCLRHG